MASLDQLSTPRSRPPRRLAQLVDDCASDADVEICGICDDSRKVQSGDAFLCLPRARDQAEAYIREAEQLGAAAVLTIGFMSDGTSIPCLQLPDIEAAGKLLRCWFGTEKNAVKLLGVTGTDGKTSIVWMLRQALERLLGKAWGVGTLGWAKSDEDITALDNTTPSLLHLHSLLAAADEADVPALVCEVSSHGIAQGRIAGLEFDAAIWTNLGHDHLEDHGGLAAYAAIKAGFISAVADGGGSVICNADDEQVAQKAPRSSRWYGHGLYRQEVMMAWEQELPGTLRLKSGSDEICLEDIPLGDFHAENLAAVGLALQTIFDVDTKQLARLLSGITTPPGRLQPVGIGRWQAFIDYSHTPEALQRCLKSARELARNKLLVVFGCGGGRDHEKRPAMGEIAANLADSVWITSDNPRSEAPEKIAAEIVDGIPHPCPVDMHLQLDREQAIAEAISDLGQGDVLIIAGKGHEPYMEVAGRRLPWSDMDMAAQFLREKDSATGLKACA